MHRPTYPPELPLVELGYSVARRRGILVSSPERGPSKRRRLTTKAVETVAGKLVLSDAQLAVFEDFWDNYLGGGLGEFLYPDYSRAGETRPARFVGDFGYTKTADGYELRLEVELL